MLTRDRQCLREIVQHLVKKISVIGIRDKNRLLKQCLLIFLKTGSLDLRKSGKLGWL